MESLSPRHDLSVVLGEVHRDIQASLGSSRTRWCLRSRSKKASSAEASGAITAFFLARFMAALPDQLIRELRWFAFEHSRDEILQQLRIKVLSGFSSYRLRKNVRASASMLWPLRVARA